MNNQSYS